jgi:(1->4)-alpha-D-glucan 1-alpha-D-glucosylmutase
MPITDGDLLDALCAAYGIIPGYYDLWGNYHQPTIDAKQSLLGAIGVHVRDNADVHRALEHENTHGWQRIVAPVYVVRENETPLAITLTLAPDQIHKAVYWELSEETGKTRHGHWTVGETSATAERMIGEIPLKRFKVTLPCQPGTGYHHLSITTADGNAAQTHLIVAPRSCYQPPELKGGRKLWGVALQLYGLRSCRNWGIGDFGDLRSAIDILAPLGVSIVGLNPLHALFPHLPERASPYSPTSRDFLNPVYLNVAAIDEYGHCEEARQWVESQPFQARLRALRETELVDYQGVWSAKLEVLKILYRSFRHQQIGIHPARAEAFRQYQSEGGDDLHKFALFEALQEHFHRRDPNVWCWMQWPKPYRDPDSEAIADWATSNKEEIAFHQYLQWNAERQLADVHGHCICLGMAVGIYRDLAIGVDRAGAQTWVDQALYALDSSIGAPPDDFNPHGQNWGLPALKPEGLVDDAYGTYIRTLRANMRQAGALRIDHVMGLTRLFWVPPNRDPEAGAYVTYPFSDLLGILALESQRNQCMIIGEDLGTVPDEVREALESCRVLSCRILYFEKNWQQGGFKSPTDYPRQALATVGSHDLPTLIGFWQELDLKLREKLDLFPSPEHRDQQFIARARDRDEIIAALESEFLMPPESMHEETTGEDLSTRLILPVHRYLARSRAGLMLIQLEDIFEQKNQVNVPGTVNEHPNWRRKLSVSIEDWLEQGRLAYYARAIARERAPSNAK